VEVERSSIIRRVARLIVNRMAQPNRWAICFSVAREIGGPGNAQLLFLPVAYSLKITPLHHV
jgi:hypothetical protein